MSIYPSALDTSLQLRHLTSDVNAGDRGNTSANHNVSAINPIPPLNPTELSGIGSFLNMSLPAAQTGAATTAPASLPQPAPFQTPLLAAATVPAVDPKHQLSASFSRYASQSTQQNAPTATKAPLSSAMAVAQAAAELFVPSASQSKSAQAQVDHTSRPLTTVATTTPGALSAPSASPIRSSHPESRASYHLFRLQSRIQHLQEDIDLIQTMRQDEARRAIAQQEALKAAESRFREAQLEHQLQQQRLQQQLQQQLGSETQPKSLLQSQPQIRPSTTVETQDKEQKKLDTGGPSTKSQRRTRREREAQKVDVSAESSSSSSETSSDDDKSRSRSRSRSSRRRRSRSKDYEERNRRHHHRSRSESRSRTRRSHRSHEESAERGRGEHLTRSRRSSYDDDSVSYSTDSSDTSLSIELRRYYTPSRRGSPAARSAASQRTPRSPRLSRQTLFKDLEYTPRSEVKPMLAPSGPRESRKPFAPTASSQPMVIGAQSVPEEFLQFQAFQRFLAAREQTAQDNRESAQPAQPRFNGTNENIPGDQAYAAPQSVYAASFTPGFTPQFTPGLRPQPIPAFSAPSSPQSQIVPPNPQFVTPGPRPASKQPAGAMTAPKERATRPRRKINLAKVIAAAVREAVKTERPQSMESANGVTSAATGKEVLRPLDTSFQTGPAVAAGSRNLPVGSQLQDHQQTNQLTTQPTSQPQTSGLSASAAEVSSQHPQPLSLSATTQLSPVPQSSNQPSQVIETQSQHQKELERAKIRSEVAAELAEARTTEIQQTLSAKLQRERAKTRIAKHVIAAREGDIARLRQIIRNLGAGDALNISEEEAWAEGNEAALRSKELIDLLAGEDSEVSSEVSDGEPTTQPRASPFTRRQSSAQTATAATPASLRSIPATPRRFSTPARKASVTISQTPKEEFEHPSTPKQSDRFSQSGTVVTDALRDAQTLEHALTDLASATSWIEHLTARCKQLQQQCGEMREQKEKAESEAKASKDAAVKSLSDADTALNNALQQLTQKQSRIEELTAQLSAEKSRVEEERSKVEEERTRCEKRIAEERAKFEAELAQLERQKDRTIHSLEKRLTEAQEELAKLRAQAAEGHLVEGGALEAKKANEELEAVRDELKLTQQALLHRDVEARERESALDAELADLRSKFNAAVEEVAQLRELLTQTDSARAAAESESNRNNECLTELRNKYAEQERSIAALVDAASAFRVELEQARAALEASEQRAVTAEAHARECELEAARYRDLAELAAVRAEDGSMNEAAAKTAQQVAQQQREELFLTVARLQGDLTGLNTELEVTKAESQRRSNEILNLRLENESLREELRHANDQKQALVMELKDTARKVKEREDAIALCQGEIDSLNQAMAELRESHEQKERAVVTRELRAVRKAKVLESHLGLLRRSLARAIRAAAVSRAAAVTVDPPQEHDPFLVLDEEKALDAQSTSSPEVGSYDNRIAELPDEPDPELEMQLEKRIQELLLEICPPTVVATRETVRVGSFDVPMARLLGCVEAHLHISKLRESIQDLKRTHDAEIRRMQRSVVEIRKNADEKAKELVELQRLREEESTGFELALQHAQETITRLNSDIQTEKATTSSLQSQLRAAEAQSAQLQQELKNAESDLRKRLESAREEVERTYSQRLAEANQRVIDAERRMEALQVQFSQQLRTTEQLYEQSSMERENHFLAEAARVKKEFTEYVAKLKKKIENLEQVCRDAEARESELSEKVSKLESQLRMTLERAAKAEAKAQQEAEAKARAVAAATAVSSASKITSSVVPVTTALEARPTSASLNVSLASQAGLAATADAAATIKRGQAAFSAKYGEFLASK